MDKTGLEVARRGARVSLIIATLFVAANCSGLSVLGSDEPAAGSYFTVTAQRGDSVSRIAHRYQVATDDIVAMNNLSNPDRLYVGQALKIPANGREQDKPAAHETVTANYAPSHAAISRSDLPPPDAARPVSASFQPAPTAPPSAETHPWWPNIDLSGGVHADADAQFVWPVRGTIIAPYGAQPNGEQNDGINIAAVDGAPVRAAADGTVSYVGNELKGYGNLVLIRHDNDYVTAYAHAGRIVVERGDHVSQGQIIAYAGESGGASAPQLHFEIRRGTTPVDPKPLLVASR